MKYRKEIENRLIGYRTIHEEEVVSEGTEYAGHDRSVRLLPGRYPIICKMTHQGFGVYLCCEIDATLESEYFVSRVGSHTSGRHLGTKGEPTKHHWTPRDYEVAMSQDPNSRYSKYYDVELAEGIGTRELESIWLLTADGQDFHSGPLA